MNSFFLKQLEKTLNRYLSLDPESSKRLSQLEGDTITIELLPFKFCFQLSIHHKKICLSAGDPLPAEIKIRGTPINLLTLTLAQDKKKHFFEGTVSIEGSAELGQEIMALFNQVEIDWEEYLSRLIGDLPAHHFGRFTKKIFAWGKEARENLRHNINEYIHEEKPWFPPTEALEDFYRDVDDLRLDLDRLEAKIKLLRA